MAQLYFKYGAMGASKTANVLMTRFNYEERGQQTLLVKPRMDTRDGDHMVASRIGLSYPCIYFDELKQLTIMELQQNACILVDEAQFLTSRATCSPEAKLCWHGRTSWRRSRPSAGAAERQPSMPASTARERF